MAKQIKSEYDFLNYSNDDYIKKKVTKDEIIEFTDKIIKINKYGLKQERNIIITNKGIYNLKKKENKRRIDLKVIQGITLSKLSDEFVIHCCDDDYDYRYISSKKKTIVEILAKYYFNVVGYELKLFELNVSSLSQYVTSKKEKSSSKSTSHMPTTNAISIGEYIYGTKSKINLQNKQSTVKQTGKIEAKTKVELEDFNIISTIGRGSCGKVLLVSKKGQKELYTIKSIRKDQILSESMLENILTEKNILSEMKCEFLLHMSDYFKSKDRIYFVTPFIKGGDMYTKLKNDGHFSEELTRFYASQIAIGLQHLHDYGMAYRDLKPENILIDEDGYIKLCDFGASVHFQGTKKENSFAGSPEYASPEMIAHEGHTIMTDWWSFGILIYEFLFGITPFYNKDKNRMFELIEIGELKFPKKITIGETEMPLKISEDAMKLISKLLEKNPNSRLGKKGLSEIKSHPFFSGINFDSIKAKKTKAPFKPTFNESEPTQNFDEDYVKMPIKESPVQDWIVDYDEWFDEFGKEQDDN